MSAKQGQDALLVAEALVANAAGGGMIDLECRRGMMTVITGPSLPETGSWLRTLAGIEPAASGRRRILGHEDPAGTWRACGYVDPEAPLLSTLDVRMNIMLPRLYHLGESHAAARRFTDRLLDEIGYTARRDVPPARLSPLANMQALLARALALEPRLLFLDEPFSLATIAHWPQLAEPIVANARDRDRSVMLATRNLDFAARHADQLVHVDGEHVSVHHGWREYLDAAVPLAFVQGLPFHATESRA